MGLRKRGTAQARDCATEGVRKRGKMEVRSERIAQAKATGKKVITELQYNNLVITLAFEMKM